MTPSPSWGSLSNTTTDSQNQPSGYLCTNLELPPEVLNLPGEQRVPRASLPTVPEFSWKEGHSCFCLGPGLSLPTTVTKSDSEHTLHPILRSSPPNWCLPCASQTISALLGLAVSRRRDAPHPRRVNTTHGKNCECIMLSVTGIYEWFSILFSD